MQGRHLQRNGTRSSTSVMKESFAACMPACDSIHILSLDRCSFVGMRVISACCLAIALRVKRWKLSWAKQASVGSLLSLSWCQDIAIFFNLPVDWMAGKSCHTLLRPLALIEWPWKSSRTESTLKSQMIVSSFSCARLSMPCSFKFLSP